MILYSYLRLVFLVLTLTILLIDLSAQTNFLKGYYVDINGDTTNGYIELRFEKAHSRFFSFKKTHINPNTKIGPNEVLGYGIKDKAHYISLEYKNQLLFFKIIVSGELSLLVLPNQKKMIFPKPEYFIYDKNSSKLYKLSLDKEILEVNGTQYLNSDGYTRGLLKALMPGQAVLHKIIDDAINIYQESVLESIFIAYYERKGVEYHVYGEVNIKPHVSIDLNIGVALRRMIFSNIQDLTIEDDILKFGFSTFLFLPKVNENILITYSINFSNNDYYSFFQTNNVKNDLNLEYDYLEHSLGLRFKELTNLNVNFDINFITAFPINKSTTWRKETLSQSIVSTENVTNQEVLASRYLGLSFTIGKDLTIYKTAKANLFLEYSHSEAKTSISSIRTMETGIKIYLVN